jgi:hypothetical protein
VLEGGEWSAARLGHFIPGKETRYPFHRKLGELWGRCGWVRKVSPLPGFEPRTVQSVTSRYTDYVIPLNKEGWKVILIKPERRGWCLIRDHYISILCSDSVPVSMSVLKDVAACCWASTTHTIWRNVVTSSSDSNILPELLDHEDERTRIL